MLRGIDRILTVASLALAVLLVVLLFTGPGPLGTSSGGYGGGHASAARSGESVFRSAGCAGCHTLQAAGAHGSTGPDLDQVRPSAAEVRSIVASGRGGMPSFSSRLSERQIAAVAAYVARVAGR